MALFFLLRAALAPLRIAAGRALGVARAATDGAILFLVEVVWPVPSCEVGEVAVGPVTVREWPQEALGDVRSN